MTTANIESKTIAKPVASILVNEPEQLTPLTKLTPEDQIILEEFYSTAINKLEAIQ